jgi:hypothetical protein
MQTPGIVRFAVWLTFFNTWVLFEETVVDRYGLWEYMPYYRVGRLCSWDIGAMALIGFVVWRVFRPASTQGRGPWLWPSQLRSPSEGRRREPRR